MWVQNNLENNLPTTMKTFGKHFKKVPAKYGANKSILSGTFV
jgi:hypothetical protein